MILVSSSYDEDEVFYNYSPEDNSMVDIFVLIMVIFGVCSFGLCVCSQTLKTSTNLNLFTACPVTKEISRFGSFKTCISWAFFNPRTRWPWLETSKTPKLVKPKVQEILCESHGLLLPPLMDDLVAKHIFTWLPMDMSMWHLHWVNKT